MLLPACAPYPPLPSFRAETRLYVGFDGFAGFRTGRLYRLRYYWYADGEIAIALDHLAPSSPLVGPVLVTPKRFNSWWLLPPASVAVPIRAALLAQWQRWKKQLVAGSAWAGGRRRTRYEGAR